MSFNFSQLQQSVDMLLVNSSESITKLKELAIDPAKDVVIRSYDANGNLITQTVPNLQKVINNVQSNINSIVAKTVYVNQTNGNDNNDGTQSRPFKTLQKAVDTCPPGGYISINIVGDYTLDNNVIISGGRFVVITLNGKISSTWIPIQANGLHAITRFYLRGFSTLILNSGPDLFEIYVPPSPQGVEWQGGAFIETTDVSTSFIRIRPSDNAVKKIEVNQNAFIGLPTSTSLVHVHLWASNSSVKNASYFKLNNSNLFYLQDSNLIGRFSTNIPVTKDETPINNNNFQSIVGYGNQTNIFNVTYYIAV